MDGWRLVDIQEVTGSSATIIISETSSIPLINLQVT